MAQVMQLGGRKALPSEEIEARRQSLLEGLTVRRGELADAESQVAALTAQLHRLEGGILECDWALAQIQSVEPKEEP